MLKYLIIYLSFQFYSSKNNLVKVNHEVIAQNNSQIYHPNSISNTRKNPKNIIVGIISRYHWKTVLPFFKSIIESNFNNCDVVMFVRDVSNHLIEKLHKIGVIVYRIPEKYNNISTINIRWKLYADFLSENKEYELVFSADVRDTIFQKNIFDYYKNNTKFLGVAIEDGLLTEELNKKWVISVCGTKIYETIMNERIICVGSIWGTYHEFLEFSNLFYQKLLAYPNSVEQGIANYLFYHEKIFGNYIIKSDNYGPVMTIGLTNRENIHLDFKDNILNFNGKIAAVIHQYDRKDDIVEIIKKKYCPELLQSFISSDENSKKMNEKNIRINETIEFNLIKKIYRSENNILLFYESEGLFIILLLIKIKFSSYKL